MSGSKTYTVPASLPFTEPAVANRVAEVNDAVLGSASDAADSGQRVAGNLGDTVSDAPTAVARKAQGSPIAAGLIAFGAGLLVSSMLPAAGPNSRPRRP